MILINEDPIIGLGTLTNGNPILGNYVGILTNGDPIIGNYVGILTNGDPTISYQRYNGDPN
jgi:hypothetical protein